MKKGITTVNKKKMDVTITGLEVAILSLFHIVQLLRCKNEKS